MARLAAQVAQHRDRHAFGILFDHFAPRINAYLLKLGMQPGQAEEITQEVMLALWRKAELFDPARSSLSTWLYRVARNRRIDAARRERTGRLDENEPLLIPDSDPAPDSGLDTALREKTLRRAIGKLPREQMEIIRLSFFLGRSHSEIAGETGLAMGTVKSRIRLAFSRLRAALDDDHAIDRARD